MEIAGSARHSAELRDALRRDYKNAQNRRRKFEQYHATHPDAVRQRPTRGDISKAELEELEIKHLALREENQFHTARLATAPTMARELRRGSWLAACKWCRPTLGLLHSSVRHGPSKALLRPRTAVRRKIEKRERSSKTYPVFVMLAARVADVLRFQTFRCDPPRAPM